MQQITKIQPENYDINFAKLTESNAMFVDAIFDHCKFEYCDFSQTEFNRCKFVDCEFELCNLSAVQFKACIFTDIVFAESKMMGINWTQANWPQINLICPLKFYQCNLSHSSFFELSLSEMVLENCEAHDVDFRGANCRNAQFNYTDFTNSLFTHANLQKADFCQATNYVINILDSNIKEARFSLPEAISLLQPMGIEIAD